MNLIHKTNEVNIEIDYTQAKKGCYLTINAQGSSKHILIKELLSLLADRFGVKG